MYLGIMNENVKSLFLELAIHVAMADNKLQSDEKLLLDSYCHEMGIPFREQYNSDMGLSEILEVLNKQCSEKEKRIIFIELEGLVIADNEIAESEQEIMENIRVAFGFSEEMVKICLDALLELKGVYNKMAAIINE